MTTCRIAFAHFCPWIPSRWRAREGKNPVIGPMEPVDVPGTESDEDVSESGMRL